MIRSKQEKKPPRLATIALMAAGTAVILVFTPTPWNFIPVSVTEDVMVLATIEQGCVGESQYGTAVVVPECNAQVGETVSATFYIPSMEVNGYYEKLQERVQVVQP